MCERRRGEGGGGGGGRAGAGQSVVGFKTFPRGAGGQRCPLEPAEEFHELDGLENSVLHPGDTVVRVQKLIQTPMV